MVIQLYSYSFSPIGKEFHDILSGITGQSGRLKENHPRECVTARKAVPYCRIFDQNCDNRRILLYFCFTLQSGLRRGQQHCRRSRAAVSARIPQRTSVHSHRAVHAAARWIFRHYGRRTACSQSGRPGRRIVHQCCCDCPAHSVRLPRAENV